MEGRVDAGDDREEGNGGDQLEVTVEADGKWHQDSWGGGDSGDWQEVASKRSGGGNSGCLRALGKVREGLSTALIPN